MDGPEPIIGLKAVTHTTVDPAALDSIFSSDESADFDFSDSSQFSAKTSLVLARQASCQFVQPPKDRIENLCDATPRITAFLATLDESGPPAQFVGDLYFIPEHTVSESVTRLLNELAHDRDKALMDQILATDSTTFPDTLLAQLELVRYLRDGACDLAYLVGKKLDSRVMSLIHFVLSKTDDKGLSAMHLISSIEEMVKFPLLAPLSVFFEGYSLEKLITDLGKVLNELFPRNPILPSVIHKLERYAPGLSEEVECECENDDDDDDDFSDDFFESLQQMKSDQNSTMFEGLFHKEVSNPLRLDNEIPKSITTVNEPPATATFLLEDGTDRMSPMVFRDWLLSCRCERKEMLRQAQGFNALKNRKEGRARDKTIQSDPLVGLRLDSDEKTQKTEDVELANFYNSLDTPLLIVRQMPAVVSLDEVSLYLPLVHTINASTAKAVTTGFMYPRILVNEFDVHLGLLHNDIALVDRILAYFSSSVSSELKEESEKVVISMLPEKRTALPMIAAAPPTLTEALETVDYEFVCRGRSPLTGATIGPARNEFREDVILSDPAVRGRILYYLYTTKTFSPYVSFRLAFALALNIMESDPELACAFMFEGLYTLLNAFKPVKVIPIVRFAFFCFAEILEKIGSFYYGVIALDNFFVADTTDTNYSSAVAQMCVRNRDYLRAAFHYTQGLRNYVKAVHPPEALFVAQVLSGIYTDGGLSTTAISLLAFLLSRTYSIGTGYIREKGTTVSFGSLKAPSKKARTTSFQPDAKSFNTVLLAVKLIGLLIKRRMFDIAERLLGSVEEMASTVAIQRLTKYCRATLYLRKNQFGEFLAAIPNLNVPISRGATSHFTVSAACFDTAHSTIKLLATGYLIRRCYSESLFWSEMFIFTSRNLGLKNIGYGYFLRGVAMAFAYASGKYVIEFTDELPGNMGMAKMGIVSRKSISREEAFVEGLSSFMMARQCFERIGSVLLQVKAYLHFTDLFLRKFDPENKEFSLEVPVPTMICQLARDKGYTPTSMFTPFVAKLETLSMSLNVIEKLVGRLMNPWDVITHQVFSAKVNFLNDEVEVAKQYFGFAMDNLTKYFCCGVEFIPKRASVKKIVKFYTVLQHACDVLLWFEQDYINKHLYIFDIMNNVRHTLDRLVKEPAENNPEIIRPSIDITEEILDLANPHLPEFKGLLEANGYIGKKDDPMDSPIIEDMLKQIGANVHLFEVGKFSEDEMVMKNTKICRRIEARSETLRRQKSSEIPVETDFDFAVRACPYAEGCVFVQRIFDKIAIYVPKTGRKRIVAITPKWTKVTVKDGDSATETEVHRCTKDTVSIFMSLLNEKHKPIQPKAWADMRSWLFGTMPFPTFRVVNDDRRFQKFSKNGITRKIKGALATMSCGNSVMVLIASVDMQRFPFEMLLTDTCIVRRRSYISILRRPLEQMQVPRFTVLKTISGDDSRPIDILGESSFCLGGQLREVRLTKKRISQFLWFSPKKDASHFQRKYPFLDVIKVSENEMPRFANGSQVLILLTYTDMFTVPSGLDKLFRDYPFASFMFIPCSVCRDALKLIKKIMARHEERIKYFEKNKSAAGLECQMAVVHDWFVSVTTIQQTLMRELKVPIPIFIPV